MLAKILNILQVLVESWNCH